MLSCYPSAEKCTIAYLSTHFAIEFNYYIFLPQSFNHCNMKLYKAYRFSKSISVNRMCMYYFIEYN